MSSSNFQHHLSTVGTHLYTTETQCGSEAGGNKFVNLPTRCCWECSFHLKSSQTKKHMVLMESSGYVGGLGFAPGLDAGIQLP